MNMPRALAVLFECLRDTKLSPAEQLAFALSADEVLGLSLGRARQVSAAAAPADVVALAEKRAAARRAKDFAASDALRGEIAAKGWEVKDKAGGKYELVPKNG